MGNVVKQTTALFTPAMHNTMAEDAEDLAVFDERSHETLVTYEDLLKELKTDGRI